MYEKFGKLHVRFWSATTQMKTFCVGWRNQSDPALRCSRRRHLAKSTKARRTNRIPIQCYTSGFIAVVCRDPRVAEIGRELPLRQVDRPSSYAPSFRSLSRSAGDPKSCRYLQRAIENALFGLPRCHDDIIATWRGTHIGGRTFNRSLFSP